MESRSDKYVLPLIAALGAVVPACGGSAESYDCTNIVAVDAGGDAKPEVEASADVAKEADAADEFVTRGQLVRDLVFEVMGYGGECSTHVFSDVPFQGELCRAVEVMESAGYIGGYPDGNFRPDNSVNRAELSKLAAMTMGYVPNDGSPCLSYFNDVKGDEWFASSMGALCENGYQLTDAEGNARPGDVLTVNEWQGFKDAMNAKLVGPVSRGEEARLLAEIVRDGGGPVEGCVTDYADVADGTAVCSSVKYVTENGVMSAYKDANGTELGVFGTNDPVNYAQAGKLFAVAAEMGTSTSGCSGAPQSSWYGGYLDALCDNGLIDSGWNQKAAENVGRRDAYKLAWDSRIWRNKNQVDGGK